jgi:hypothetical protein
MTRKATKRLYDMLDQGLLSYEAVVDMCTSAMSEDDVADMMDANELSERFFEDDEYLEDYETEPLLTDEDE